MILQTDTRVISRIAYIMSRLSLPHNSPLETFLSALRGRINQTRLDLAPLVDSERLDAINDRSAAEQAEFHAILLQLVPTQWLPPRPPPKARALFSQICMSVRRSALAPTTSAPTSTVTAPSSLGNSAQNLPPPRMTMAEARAQLSRQEQPMNESSSPLVSVSLAVCSSNLADDISPLSGRLLLRMWDHQSDVVSTKKEPRLLRPLLPSIL